MFFVFVSRVLYTYPNVEKMLIPCDGEDEYLGAELPFHSIVDEDKFKKQFILILWLPEGGWRVV